MIFKNKDAQKSSLFGEKSSETSRKSVNPSVLEGFFRKQSIKVSDDNNSNILKNKISRSSTNNDDRNAGEIFLGKSSSRSLFNPDSIENLKHSGTREIKSNKFLPNSKVEVSEDVASDLIKFKNNFNNASKSAGSHGMLRSDRVSIFDKEPFERIAEKQNQVEEKSIDEKKISKSFSSKEISSSLFDKLSVKSSEKTKTNRQKSLDKIFGDEDGKI